MDFLASILAVVLVYRKQLLLLLLVVLLSAWLFITVKQPPIEFATDPAIKNTSVAVAKKLAVGQNFASLAALKATLQHLGYVSTGRFGNSWPAEVTEILDDRDGIRFTRQDGTRHNYTGFEGYWMKVVRLRGRGHKESLVVFRSMEKV